MATEIPRLHFHRFEFKYIVSGEVLDRIERELELRMERDRHAGPDGSYPIRSIYFDSDIFHWLAEKKAGLHERYKFRLRTYDLTNRYSDPVFLELKGKSDVLVYKHRQFLQAAGLGESMTSGMVNLCESIVDADGDIPRVGEQFVHDVFRMRLSPSVVVDYRRTAFENSANPDFRVTIDRDVFASRAGCDGLPRGIPHELARGYAVLEIKFRYHLPAWFHRLIGECELWRKSFSKFERATDAVYMTGQAARLNRLLERKTACLR
jgi:hypothetical protein